MIVNFRGVALLLACSLTPLFAADGWPMYLYDLSHSSFNPYELQIGKHNVTSLAVNWVIDLAAPIAAAPTISGGVAYVGPWARNFSTIHTRPASFPSTTFLASAADPPLTFS